MLVLLLLPFFQLLHGLDVSSFVPKVSADTSPCKNCKILVQSFERVLHLQFRIVLMCINVEK